MKWNSTAHDENIKWQPNDDKFENAFGGPWLCALKKYAVQIQIFSNVRPRKKAQVNDISMCSRFLNFCMKGS
jgi:hypothetical protein